VNERLLVIEPLGAHHDRTTFDCGEPILNEYLGRQAAQDVKRRVARVFVGLGDAPRKVDGYYTVSATSFERSGLPPALSKRLPYYPVPAALIGRLAIDRERQGRGLGEALLLDAMRRVLRASMAIAVHAIVVDAKNARARAFYERYGFMPFAGHGRRLFIALGTVEKLGL
jgi:ribosomal protein S18 acetylase RimI-like enzyme